MKPATRSALILVGIVVSGFGLGAVWVYRAAMDVKHLRDQRSVESNAEMSGMVWIPAGKFTMGATDGPADEAPLHDVKVNGFWMDKTEVTNEQFAKFVKATRYVTIAERKPDPKLFPGVPEDKLVPGSVVFQPQPNVTDLSDWTQWWAYVPGANWQHPEGPDSTIADRMKHPVVHVAWDDAVAYCNWAG
jgi:sulfatase modifying factor 1